MRLSYWLEPWDGASAVGPTQPITGYAKTYHDKDALVGPGAAIGIMREVKDLKTPDDHTN